MTAPTQQKLKVNGPVVVTANRLGDGVVIYRTADGWTTELNDAAIVTTALTAKEMLAAAVADDLGAVGAYVAPVALNGIHVEPGNLRERIRITGPTFDLPATANLVQTASHVCV